MMQENHAAYPLKAVEQNAVFYGINGFTLLGTHGPGYSDFQNGFLAINRHELHAEGVKKAVRYAKAHLADVAAHSITEYLLTDAVKEMLCVKNLPEYLKQRPDYAAKATSPAASLEEYGWRAQDIDYKETLHEHFCDMDPQRKAALMEAHKSEIATTLAQRTATALGCADKEMAESLRERMDNYLGKIEMSGGIFMARNQTAMPQVEALVRELLIRHLDAIERRAESFANEARWFIERPVAIAGDVCFRHFPPEDMPLPADAKGNGKRVWYAPWKRRTPELAVPPPEPYERPMIDPAPHGPDMGPVLSRIDEVLMQDFTPQMRALILDQSAQILVTGEKTDIDGSHIAMYARQSHADNYRKIVHLWHNAHHPFTKDALLHTEDKKVIREEFLHYACGHPAMGLDDQALGNQWLTAFQADLGGYGADYGVDEKQKAARELIRANFVGRCMFSWDRHNFGYTGPMINEVSAEFFICEKAGVGMEAMREAFPHLYPLYQELLQMLHDKGQAIMDRKPDIARWAHESMKPYVMTETHASLAGPAPGLHER